MESPRAIRVIGGGPAGATAAITARREGAHVRLSEKSHLPRHKVCGEFLSPDAALVFERLGILPAFLNLRPFPVSAAQVVIGSICKRWKLDEPAFGISRFALDHFLLTQAQEAGADVVRETGIGVTGPVVIASGRHQSAPAGTRHFGFKAHFSGPSSDSIDLLFERDMYVGINCIESGMTNVCGLASEQVLRQVGFKPEALLHGSRRLRERLAPLSKKMDWLITGPLVYGRRPQAGSDSSTYLAGDALGFVDPFTGSGMLGALATGYLAGLACARGLTNRWYIRECNRVLGAQYLASSLFRHLVSWGIADKLAGLVSGNELFRVTRPGVRRMLQKPG